MDIEITREAIETLAKQEGISALQLITTLQAGAVQIKDETTLDRLCEIKSELLGL
jgi:hypothetical protein